MTDLKTFLKRILTVSLLAFIAVIYSCQTSTDLGPDPDPDPDPVIVEGELEFVIEVTNRQDEPLTGYDIDIDGPTSVSESGVTSSTFVLTEFESGEYTITVSLDGYITGTITVEIELPDDISESYSATEIIALTKQAPPVQVNNGEDSTVSTAPSEDPDDEGAETEIEIPAGSFPADALDEDGNIEIRVTRSQPNQITEDEDGTVQDFFDFEPAGLELNNDITIRIPIDAVEGVEYLLQPGNIPLELDSESGVLTANLSASFLGRRFRGRINRFERFRVVPRVRIERTQTFSTPVALGRSACGEAFSATYDFSSGDFPKIITRFTGLHANRPYSRNVSYSGKPNTILEVSAQNRTITFDIVSMASGNVISTATVNFPTVRSQVNEIGCHNSGGG